MSSSSKSTNKKSAVSNVVNDLIRAAVGGNTNEVADDDLDKYVADLILKEAEAKRKKYDNVGVRAYQPDFGVQSNNLPKPNKRFFLNMIKATDNYNQSLKEQEEELARKKEHDRRQRKRREGDSDHSSDEHRKRQRRRYDSEHDNSPYSDHDELSLSRRRNRYNDDNQKEEEREDRVSKYRYEDEKLDNEQRSHKKKHSDHRHHHHHHRSDDKIPENTTQTTASVNKNHSRPVVVRGRGQATQGGSKMDKYFSKSYDPALDVEPDLDQLVYTEFKDDSDDAKRKKKKKKDKKDRKKKSKKKKSSKRKREETDSDDSEDDDDRSISPPPSKPTIRAWDIGK